MTQRASEQISEEVTSWPGVELAVDSFDSVSFTVFTVGRREIGHLHGDHVAHFSFPKRVWAELRVQGRITHHPVFPDRAGPAARAMADDADIRDVIELLRLNYNRALARHGLPAEAA